MDLETGITCMLRMRLACSNLSYFHPIVPFPFCNFSSFVLFFFSFFSVYTHFSRLSSLFITVVMFLPLSTDSVFLIHCFFSSYLLPFHTVHGVLKERILK